MGGYEEHVAIIGDWMPPPSPSPRAFFSAMLGDDDGDIGLRSISEPTGVHKNGTHHLDQHDPTSSADDDNEKESAGDQATKQLEEEEYSTDQKMGSRGGGSLLERRGGFNAPRLNTLESIRPPPPGLLQNSDIRSPYLTIPPGLSPTTLLDSPVFLSNSLVQPSPTTGKFPFPPSGSSGRSSMFMRDGPDHKTKDNNFFDSFTSSSSSFAFKPVAESTPSLFLGAPAATKAQQSFPSIDVSVESDNSILPRNVEPAKLHSQSGTSTLHHLQAEFSRSSVEKDDGLGGSAEQSPPLDEEQEQEEEEEEEDPDQRVSGSAPSDDGYNWRKYGQKQVKGSEYPRSYYKCTHPNCPVKKKVERSHEGHITEIIYKGAHNHPKPPSNRRSAVGSSNAISSDMQYDGVEQCVDQVWKTMQKGGTDWRQDNVVEVTSSGPLGTEYGNNVSSNNFQAQYESVGGDAVDRSSTFSNEEDEDDRATHGSASLAYDGEGDESESKRRKVEAYAATDVSGASRAIREPRVVVQTTSEVDILDDGYRWRKYGQKVVKGNPNPRSYYKCTNAGCSVRKHVERASHDLKSVITTYEGKHNHDVPAARNSSHHVNNNNSNTPISSASSQSATAAAGGLSQIHRPEPSHQLHNNMARSHSLASFGLPPGMNHHHRQQLGGGGSHGFGFGMNQQGGLGLASLAMAGFGSNQGKMHNITAAMPVHPSYLGHPPRQMMMSEMAQFMMPKGEPKVEPMLEPGLNLTNGSSSVYHQIMSRLPLEPHM